MQSNDDSPRPSTRPSLLTPAQQAEADRNRILSHLDGGRRPAPVPHEGRRGGRLAVWGGMLAGAMLLLATGAWLGQRETAAGTEAETEPVLAGAAPAPPAPAVAAATAAASIREEEPQALPQQSLSEMLGADLPVPAPAPVPVPVRTKAPVKPAVHAPADVLSKALETPQKSAPKAAPQKKPAAKPPKPADPVKPAKPAATPEQESDVALLAALVSHGQAGAGPKKMPPSLQAQLQQCSKLKPAAADSCRQRTCSGRTGKPLCKAARAAKGAQ